MKNAKYLQYFLIDFSGRESKHFVVTLDIFIVQDYMQKDFFFFCKSHRIQKSVMKTWDSYKCIFTIARPNLSQEFINMLKFTLKDPICSNL